MKINVHNVFGTPQMKTRVLNDGAHQSHDPVENRVFNCECVFNAQKVKVFVCVSNLDMNQFVHTHCFFLCVGV